MTMNAVIAILRWIAAPPLAILFWGIVGNAGTEAYKQSGLLAYLFVQMAALGAGGLIMRIVAPSAHRRAAAVVWGSMVSAAYLGVVRLLRRLEMDTGRPADEPVLRIALVLLGTAIYVIYEWRRPDAAE